MNISEFQQMSREELSDYLNASESVKIEYKDVKLEKEFPSCRPDVIKGNKKFNFFSNDRDDIFWAIYRSNVVITKDDIIYLTDYENYKSTIDGITGRNDLNFRTFRARINNYNICVEADGEVFYLPIMKYYRDDEGLTYREMLASELFEHGRDRMSCIEKMKGIAKNIYEDINFREKLGIYEELSDSDKKEFVGIINNNRNPEYARLWKDYKENKKSEFSYFDKAYYRGEKLEFSSINMIFAAHGLSRINYVKGKLYIDGKEVNKKDYYAKNVNLDV